MANLQRCSRCKSEIDISFFGLNRKKQPYKTCINCRNTANKKPTTCTKPDATALNGDDGSWKTLFGVPNSTHTDFRSFLLWQGWQQVYESAMVARGEEERNNLHKN